MATRRDLFQSYQFMMQRLISGVVLRESDPPQSPLRRMGGAAFASVMIAVISLAAAGVIGVIKPGGNKTWRSGEAVIVDESTGAEYVYIKNQKGERELHPVPNLASGALLAGTSKTVSVASKSLDGVARSATIGIAGAPDILPDKDHLSDKPWTLCSLRAETKSGEEIPNTSLSIGRTYTEGIGLEHRTILVRDTEADALYLVMDGRRYAVPKGSEAPVLDGLGLRSIPQIRVGSAWVNALPSGSDLTPVTVPSAGQPSTAVPGARAGQVMSVSTGGATQYYLVLPAKLMPLQKVQALITLASPDLAAAYDGKAEIEQLAPATAAAAPKKAPSETSPTDFPAEPPETMAVASDRSTVCATFEGSTGTPSIAVEARVEGAELAAATVSRTQNGTVLANRVQVDGGLGVLVHPMASPTSTDAMTYLVTDRGIRYAITSKDAQSALGYQTATPIEMPASIVSRIPEGPALDIEAAKYPL